MKVRGIDFVVYYVSSLQRAIEFYRDTLGLPFDAHEPRTKDESTNHWKESPLEPVFLALAGPWSGSRPPQLPPHIALAVEDIRAAIEELRGKGISVDGPEDDGGECYMAWFQDPFGNWLMLHQRKDGTWG